MQAKCCLYEEYRHELMCLFCEGAIKMQVFFEYWFGLGNGQKSGAVQMGLRGRRVFVCYLNTHKRLILHAIRCADHLCASAQNQFR